MCCENLAQGTKPFLIGHSLGGTLAAIFAASAPGGLRGLVLLGAPLCFRPATSQFRDTLVSLVPSTLSETDPAPLAINLSRRRVQKKKSALSEGRRRVLIATGDHPASRARTSWTNIVVAFELCKVKKPDFNA